MRNSSLFFALALLILVAGCLSWPASGPVTQPTTAPPATGSLDLSSAPEGCEIYIDQVYRGTTPSVIPDIPAGSHALEFRCHDYLPWTKTIDVTGGNRSYIHASLSPVTTVPTTVITTIPVTKTTTKSITILTETGPAGCWKMLSPGNGTLSYGYLYELSEDGTGWMDSIIGAKGTYDIVNSRPVVWWYDQGTGIVKIVDVERNEQGDGGNWKYGYEDDLDVLNGGVMGNVSVIFRRTECS